MKPRIEVVAIDSLMVRLFDRIDEANMPWMLAASQRLRSVRRALIDLVPSYTTLMVQFDLPPNEARLIARRSKVCSRTPAAPGGAMRSRCGTTPVSALSCLCWRPAAG
jgi:allophanate hydrolase subunit 1